MDDGSENSTLSSSSVSSSSSRSMAGGRMGSSRGAGGWIPGPMESYERGGMCPCSNCVVAVEQDQFYTVERFGRFAGVLKPGLHCVGLDICGCCLALRSISSRVEQITADVPTISSDKVSVEVVVAVQLYVSPDHVREAVYTLDDVEAQVSSYVVDTVRSLLPKMTLDEAFRNKDLVGQAVQLRLRDFMLTFGFVICKSLVTEIRPNGAVAEAMNESFRQRKLRDAEVMAAEARKVILVKGAEANADASCLQGEGIARQRTAIIRGLRDSIQAGSGEVIAPWRLSELLLTTQHFQTLRDIAAKRTSKVVFLPPDEFDTDAAPIEERNDLPSEKDSTSERFSLFRRTSPGEGEGDAASAGIGAGIRKSMSRLFFGGDKKSTSKAVTISEPEPARRESRKSPKKAQQSSASSAMSSAPSQQEMVGGDSQELGKEMLAELDNNVVADEADASMEGISLSLQEDQGSSPVNASKPRKKKKKVTAQSSGMLSLLD